ncbi:hypothetical protein KIN20_022008 [Parelaphostrongylus tenuis]|uniref:Protein kinase domain-containing protein n=1 Tax=Parelaphostrongylus tenuis TaxID=148309 RepID=A0AAD5MQ20_PARTN|nr:hypothetical protein KIN20_022008 [Parelaphostrongylus tenuis]
MNQYRLPSTASQIVTHLIQNLLAADPSKRPNIKQVLGHEHSEIGLPASLDRRAVPPGVLSPKQIVKQDLMTAHPQRIDRGIGIARVPEDGFLSELYEQISSVCNSRAPSRELKVEDEARKPCQFSGLANGWTTLTNMELDINYVITRMDLTIRFQDRQIVKDLKCPDPISMHWLYPLIYTSSA